MSALLRMIIIGIAVYAACCIWNMIVDPNATCDVWNFVCTLLEGVINAILSLICGIFEAILNIPFQILIALVPAMNNIPFNPISVCNLMPTISVC